MSEFTKIRTRPATPAQRRLLLSTALRPLDPSSNYALLCRLEPGVDPERFAHAASEVLQANGSFNEIFAREQDGTVTATLLDTRPECRVHRYRDCAELDDKITRLADRTFDPGIWPLFHIEIAVVGDETYFALTGAHITCDAHGFYLLAAEFERRYNDPHCALRTKTAPADLPRPPLDEVAARAYFVSEFSDIRSLSMPEWGQRDSAGRIPGTITRHELSLVDSALGKDIALALGVRRYAVLLSIFGLVVHCLTGRGTVIVSTPMSNRRIPEIGARTTGLMVNVLPVRMDIDGTDTFAELCASVDRQIAHLIDFESCDFAGIARKLFTEGGVDASVPSVSFTAYPRQLAATFGGRPGTPLPVRRAYIQYPLSVNIEWSDSSACLIVERSLAIPDVNLPSLFQGLLAQLGPTGHHRLQELRWAFDDSERASIAAVESFLPSTILADFDHWVRETPERTAVEFGGERITYAELDDRSTRMADWIATEIPDDLVGLAIAPSIDLIAAMLAIAKSGKTYVPLDTETPAPRVRSIARLCRGLTVLSRDTGLWSQIDDVRVLPLPVTFPAPCGSRASVGPDGIAYVIFTSGSTGEPKGVRISHAAVARMIRSAERSLPIRGKRWSLYHSYAFDFSVWEIFGALLLGGTVCIPSAAQRRDPDRMARFVAEAGVQVLSQTPSAFQLLAPRITAIEGLETVVFGGERLDFVTLTDFATARPDIRLVNMYGITEITVHATHYRVPSDPAEFSGLSIIGRPLVDTTMSVVDGNRRVLPRGVPGELAIGGPGVMSGYLNRDDLTTARVVDIEGERTYLSGDYGYLDHSGELIYLGRYDTQIQIRGHRVELGEVEFALLNSPLVRNACALVDGEGVSSELIAFVVLDTDSDVEALRQSLRASLPGYMIPARVLAIPEMPKTMNGKADRDALRRALSEYHADGAHTPPSDDLERQIADLWSELLGHDDFDSATRFFDAGGSSALLVAMATGIRTRLGVPDLDIVDLFEYCTPASLAGHLSATRESALMGRPA